LERYVTAFFRVVLGMTAEMETLGGYVTFTIDISK